MTDKDNGYRELSAQQEKELLEDRKYLRERFDGIDCPPLPERLSANNIWKMICADGGDHQVTVDPSAMDGQFAPDIKEGNVREANTPAEIKRGEVVDFPGNKQNRKKVLTFPKRWLATACTLVMVIGLSAVFMQLNAPMKSADMVMDNAAPAQAETDTMMQDAGENGAAVPQAASVEPKAAAAKGPEAAPAAEPEVKAQVKEEETAEAEVTPQLKSAPQPQDDQPAAPKLYSAQVPEEDAVEEPLSKRDALQEQILASMGTAEIAEAQIIEDEEEIMPLEEAAEESAEESTEEAVEEIVEDTVEEEAAEEPVEEKADDVDIIKKVIIKAQKTQPQTYQTKAGQLIYEPATGKVILADKNGGERSHLKVAADAKLLVTDAGFAAITQDAENNTVTMTVYDAKDAAAPKKSNTMTMEGELFDAYTSGTGSYTVVTSIWFSREQIDAGDFLPLLNGEELDASLVNVVSGYGEEDRINYLLTTTMSVESVNTRADLYLK